MQPIRDIFGAVFFVSVGMMIEPNLLAQYWPAVLVLSGWSSAGKIAGVTGASLVIGEPPSIAIMTGFALAQIGEFSFIMADVGRVQRSNAAISLLAGRGGIDYHRLSHSVPDSRVGTGGAMAGASRAGAGCEYRHPLRGLDVAFPQPPPD